jgi:hypothetical protein
LLEDLAAAGEETVSMSAVGHALSRFSLGRKRIALEESDPTIVVGENTGGDEATDAGSDDNGVGTQLVHGLSPCRFSSATGR